MQLAALLGQQIGVGMTVSAVDIALLVAREQRVGLLGIAAFVDATTNKSAGECGSVGCLGSRGGRGQRSSGFSIAVEHPGPRVKIASQYSVSVVRDQQQNSRGPTARMHRRRSPLSRLASPQTARYAGRHGPARHRLPRCLQPPHRLEQVLGLFSVVAIVVGEVIGSGIFFKPQQVAQATEGYVGLILACGCCAGWSICVAR